MPGDRGPVLQTSHSAIGVRPCRRDLFGVLWVLAAGWVVFLPAMVHGATVYTAGGYFDQVDFFLPLTRLAWTEVHQGHLPLWNPFSALGLPLAFDWQSGTFSLPNVLGYAVPLAFSYTVSLLVTMALAGTGTYVLTRVCGLGILGSAMAATVYELSGPFLGWVGWPHAAVLALTGYLFAVVLLLRRGRHRVRYVVLLALVVAGAAYAGQPEALFTLAIALALFVGADSLWRAARTGTVAEERRFVGDLMVGTVAGLGLSAPLLIPGLQVASVSLTRFIPSTLGTTAIPLRQMTYVNEGSPYIGVTALALAVVAVVFAWRRREVKALVVVGLFMACMAFLPPLVSALHDVPLVKTVPSNLPLVPMMFAVAVLSGVGLDVLVRSPHDPAVRRWLAGTFAVALLALAVLVFAQGRVPREIGLPAPSAFLNYGWPAIAALFGLLVVWILAVCHVRADGSSWKEAARRKAGRWAGVSLLLCQSAFLATAGMFWASDPPLQSASSVALRSDVGHSIVGIGTAYCGLFYGSGILPDTNVETGIQMLTAYDPMIPYAYYRTWDALGGTTTARQPRAFCPAVATAAEARRFGVTFILEPAGKPGPPGTRLVGPVGTKLTLYEVADASRAVLVPLAPDGRLPPAGAVGSAVPTESPAPAELMVRTDSSKPAVLRLHLTDEPGWGATIDGKPLPLERYSGMMLQARVPAGRHVVTLQYWPETFTLGLVVGGVSAGAVSAFVLVSAWRRRRSMQAKGVA